MSIFGQVWLWSSLAFLLGATLCWALVALPARRRVGELESELTSRVRRYAAEWDDSDRRPGEDDRYDEYEDRRPAESSQQEDASGESLTRAYALARTHGVTEGATERGRLRPLPEPAGIRDALDGGPVAPPETDTADTELADGPRSAATQYLNVSSTDLGGSMLEASPEVVSQTENRGWFDDEGNERNGPAHAATEPRDVRLVDDEDHASAGGGTVFTQQTQPIPGELIRRLDENGTADALVDDLEGEDPGRPVGESEPVGASEPRFGRGGTVTSPPTPDTESTGPAHSAQGQTEVMPVQPAAPAEVVSAPDPTRRGAEQKIMPGVTVHADSANNPLPKRVPSKPPNRTPFGVTTAPMPERGGGTTTDSEPSRALFEPIVPAGDEPAMPPPHGVHGGNGRSPFGPGSAMPLPGGASPSPEFTIKASASAMRYCTPESPQFGVTVAEVWFKTSADAERVGFRPVG